MVAENEEYFSKEKEVFKEYVRQINKAISEDYRYVFADATHLNKASRDKLLSRLTSKPDSIIAIYMKTPLFVSIERNNQRSGRAVVPEKVIKDMYKSIQLPTKDENIDKLIIITQKEKEIDYYIENL